MAEPTPLPPPPKSHPAQFSLLGIMLAMTVVSAALALFFGIGRFWGMSNGNIATIGLTRFALAVPMLIVWTIGLTMSLSRRQQQPAYFWAALAFAGFIVSTVANSVLSMLITHTAMTSGSSQNIGLWFSLQGIVSVVLNVVCWTLLFIALFSRLRQVKTEPAIHTAAPAESPFKV